MQHSSRWFSLRLFKLLHLGDEDLSAERARLIVMTNAAALFNGVAALIAAVAFAVVGYPVMALNSLCASLSMALVLCMAAVGRRQQSRAWLTVSLVWITVIGATEAGTDFVFAVPFALVVMPFMFLGEEDRPSLIVSVAATSAAALIVYWPGLLPRVAGDMPPETATALQSLVAGLCFTGVLITGWLHWSTRTEAIGDLEAARAEADRQSRAKSMFLANMSHEIRTPLGAMLGYGDLLNRILDFSKIEADELLLDCHDVNIAEVLLDVASIMRAKAQAKGIEFRLEFSTVLPASLASDALRIRQTLLNLVGNAIQFTDSGSVVVRAGLDEGRRNLTITVCDTGVGLSQDELARAFQPFAQSGSGCLHGGTGLGLAISKRLTELLGGVLNATSKPGVGSTFSLTLPVSGKEASVLVAPSQIRRPSSERRAMASDELDGLRILLAEDFEDAAKLIVLHLEHAGASPTWVKNGAEALTAIEEAAMPFDVVVMDNQMPVLDGLSAIRQLRASGNRTPVISLTAHAMSGDRELCLEAGANDYLSKPVDFDELVGTIAGLAHEHTAGPGTSTRVESPHSGVQALTENFVRQLPLRFKSLRSALSQQDQAEARTIAHRLAGSAGMFGLPELSHVARRLERALVKGAKQSVVGALVDELENHGMAARGELPRARKFSRSRTRAGKRHTSHCDEPSILVVDDDVYVRDFLKSSLEERGFAVSLASSCHAATRSLEAGAFGLLIIDGLLPDGTGVDWIRSVRASGCETPILFVSAFWKQDSVLFRELTETLEVARMVSKPIDPPSFIALVEELVCGERSEAEQDSPPAAPSRAPRHVLVLHTEDDLTRCISEAGQTRNIEISIAESGARALEIVKERAIDAALIDADLLLGTDGDIAALLRDYSRDSELPLGMLCEHRRLAAAPPPHVGVEITVAASDDEQELGALLERLLAPRQHKAPRILVVEDDEDFATVAKDILECEGYEVATLHHPEAIFETLESFHPDVLLLDMVMPTLSGLDMCSAIRSSDEWRDLQILFATARADSSSRIESYRAGGDDYVTKPVISEELIARIRVRVDRSRQNQGRNQLDELSGVMLRRPFVDAALRELGHCNARNRPFALAVLDIDHFKRVNDSHGHPTGDRVIARLGQILHQRFRAGDLRGRWGGEEFVVAFPGQSERVARDALERLLEEFRTIEFKGDHGQLFHVTFSVGVAAAPRDGASLDELIAVADQRLYTGKHLGRAQVVAACPALGIN